MKFNLRQKSLDDFNPPPTAIQSGRGGFVLCYKGVQKNGVSWFRSEC